MSRFSLLAISLVVVFSALCHQQIEHHVYGRHLIDAMDRIEASALEQVPERDLFESAMHGMVSELDEHSAFIPQSIAKKYREDLDQNFGGIGIEVYFDTEAKQVFVSSPIIGTPRPAFDAGLRGGDRLVAINGTAIEGESLKEAVEMMRGLEGESLRLSVMHRGQSEPVEIEIVRDHISVDSVAGDRRDAAGEWIYTLEEAPRVSLLRLKTFGHRSADELTDVLTELKKQGKLQSLVIDVRDNSGGYLDAAQRICDLFIHEGMIVWTQDRNGEIAREYKASADGTFEGFPMAVLINKESASASEILAACLKDHDRAVVVGQRSFGKGSVQEMIPLEEGRSILKLTTASFWRPAGKNIHRLKTATEEDDWGVRPSESYDVSLSDEEIKAMETARRDRDGFIPGALATAERPPNHVDPQLAAAVRYLQAKLDGE